MVEIVYIGGDGGDMIMRNDFSENWVRILFFSIE